MLSDIDNKVLRIILNNYRTKGRTPSLFEIQKRTGRDENGIMHVLYSLHVQRLIKWNASDPERIAINEHICIQRGF